MLVWHIVSASGLPMSYPCVDHDRDGDGPRTTTNEKRHSADAAVCSSGADTAALEQLLPPDGVLPAASSWVTPSNMARRLLSARSRTAQARSHAAHPRGPPGLVLPRAPSMKK